MGNNKKEASKRFVPTPGTYERILQLPEDQDNNTKDFPPGDPEKVKTPLLLDKKLLVVQCPEIFITIGEIDRVKIFEFARAVPVETSLKMLVKRNGSLFHLHEPLFLEQVGLRHSTVIKREDEDRLYRQWLEATKDFNELSKRISSIRAWIHSHGGAPCFWSPLDHRTCEGYANNDFFISVVISIRKEILFYNCRLDLFPPTEEIQREIEKLGIYRPSRLIIYNLPIEVIDDRPKDFDYEKIQEDMRKLAEEKVKIRHFQFLNNT